MERNSALFRKGWDCIGAVEYWVLRRSLEVYRWGVMFTYCSISSGKTVGGLSRPFAEAFHWINLNYKSSTGLLAAGNGDSADSKIV